MSDVTITINMDEKCLECGSKGVTPPSGLCFKCITRAMSKKPMKSKAGKAYQVGFFYVVSKLNSQ
jgi:hypothetical protein